MNSIETIRKRVDLLPHQYDAMLSPTKFLALIGGIGSGKSFYGSNYIIKRVGRYPDALHFIGANTYGQLRDSTLTAMFRVLKEQGFKYSYNQSSGLLEFAGGQALCKSMDNFDIIRGIEIASFWLDEVRDLPREAFDMMMGRLRDKRAETLEGRVTSSPAGFNWIYDYFHPSGESHTAEFELIHATSFNNYHLPDGYIDSIKSKYAAEFYKQEILGEFVNIYQGQAYVNFGLHNLRDTSPFYADALVHPQLPICIGLDFNLNPFTAVLAQKRVDELYVFDEIFLNNSHTQAMSKALVEKLIEWHPNIHKLGVIIAGDATAKAGQRAAAGQSDYDIICQHLDQAKIPWVQKTPESNPAVKDRVNNMNTKFKDMNDQSHIWFHPFNCPKARRDCERVVWKQGAHMELDQSTDKELTHISDAVGYLVCALLPFMYKSKPTGLRVIYR